MEQKYPYLLIFLTGCLWGTQGIFMRQLAADGASSAWISFLRVGMGFLLLLVITLVRDGLRAFRVSRGTLISCVLLGLVSQATYNIAYTTAVNSIGIGISAVLLYASPVCTSLISKLLFREAIGRHKIAALCLNVLGCALTVTGGSLSGWTLARFGLFFGLMATLCYSLTAIFGRIATGDGTPFSVATLNFFFAALALLPLRPWHTTPNPLAPSILWHGLLLALFPTALAYVLYFAGVKHITEISRIPVIASVEIIIATALGVLLTGESLNVVKVLGICLVLGSILLMQRRDADAS